MMGQGMTVGLLTLGLLVGLARPAPAQGEAVSPERKQRAEQLLEGLDLTPAQREQLMSRLLEPRRHFGDGSGELRGRRRGDEGGPIGDEQKAEVEKFLLESNAMTKEQLERAKRETPAEHEQALRRLWRGLEEARRVEERHPERAERMRRAMTLEVRTRVLGEEYQRASDERRATLGKQLRQLLGETFEVKTAMRHDEIARLRSELNRLEEQIKLRENKRSEIIEREYSILTGQGDPLEP